MNLFEYQLLTTIIVDIGCSW